jgi:hypothetical protein
MTRRERWQMMAVFGWVEMIIGLVMIANRLVTGESSTPLTVTFALVVLSSAPIAIPLLWQKWKEFSAHA